MTRAVDPVRGNRTCAIIRAVLAMRHELGEPHPVMGAAYVLALMAVITLALVAAGVGQ